MNPKPAARLDRERARLLYVNGLSTRQIAKLLGSTPSYVHRVIQKAGLSRTRSQAAILRHPATSTHWRSARQAARKVWERANGSILEGYTIHHKDRDHANNALENLECLSARVHAHIHHPPNPVPRHLRPARKVYMQAYLRRYWRRRKEERARESET